MIAVLKLGETYEDLSLKRGDFEHWVMTGLGLGSDSVNIVDVAKGDSLPLYNRLTGAILTGSHAMVTEHLPWNERVARWIPGAVERSIPLLGICFGHQLLAYALGIDHHHDDLVREGQDPRSLMANCKDTSCGPLILRRFAGIVKDRDWERWQ